MRSSRRLLLRVTAAVTGAVALTAVVAGPAYADIFDDDADDGSVRTASEDEPGRPDEDADDDAEDREDAAEEARERAREDLEERRDRAEETDDRDAEERKASRDESRGNDSRGNDSRGNDSSTDGSRGRGSSGSDSNNRNSNNRDSNNRNSNNRNSNNRDSNNRDSDNRARAATGSTDTAKHVPPHTKDRRHEGVYGLDQGPDKLTKRPPGVYYPGLGTVEPPGVAVQ